MVSAFTFELSKCDDEIVVTNEIKRLSDIPIDLAKVTLTLFLVKIGCCDERRGGCTQVGSSKPQQKG